MVLGRQYRVCLYIMKKVEIWLVDTNAFSLTDRQGKIVLLKLLRSRSGALVTQFLASRPCDFLALDSSMTNMKKEYLFWILENPICPWAISFWLFLNSGSESRNLNWTVQNIHLPSPQFMGWVGGFTRSGLWDGSNNRDGWTFGKLPKGGIKGRL